MENLLGVPTLLTGIVDIIYQTREIELYHIQFPNRKKRVENETCSAQYHYDETSRLCLEM